MKKDIKDKSSRRKFLSLGLLSAAGLVTNKVEAMSSIAEEDEKVPMMTADGRLVQVSKKVLDQSNRKKARNADVLRWRDHDNKSGQ